MRGDVRENLLRASADELEFNDTYVILAYRDLIDHMAEQEDGWSDPVELLFTPDSARPGILEITIRRVP